MNSNQCMANSMMAKEDNDFKRVKKFSKHDTERLSRQHSGQCEHDKFADRGSGSPMSDHQQEVRESGNGSENGGRQYFTEVLQQVPCLSVSSQRVPGSSEHSSEDELGVVPDCGSKAEHCLESNKAEHCLESNKSEHCMALLGGCARDDLEGGRMECAKWSHEEIGYGSSREGLCEEGKCGERCGSFKDCEPSTTISLGDSLHGQQMSVVRSTMVSQQSIFTEQLVELHRLVEQQRSLCKSSKADGNVEGRDIDLTILEEGEERTEAGRSYLLPHPSSPQSRKRHPRMDLNLEAPPAAEELDAAPLSTSSHSTTEADEGDRGGHLQAEQGKKKKLRGGSGHGTAAGTEGMGGGSKAAAAELSRHKHQHHTLPLLSDDPHPASSAPTQPQPQPQQQHRFPHPNHSQPSDAHMLPLFMGATATTTVTAYQPQAQWMQAPHAPPSGALHGHAYPTHEAAQTQYQYWGVTPAYAPTFAALPAGAPPAMWFQPQPPPQPQAYMQPQQQYMYHPGSHGNSGSSNSNNNNSSGGNSGGVYVSGGMYGGQHHHLPGGMAHQHNLQMHHHYQQQQQQQQHPQQLQPQQYPHYATPPHRPPPPHASDPLPSPARPAFKRPPPMVLLRDCERKGTRLVPAEEHHRKSSHRSAAAVAAGVVTAGIQQSGEEAGVGGERSRRMHAKHLPASAAVREEVQQSLGGAESIQEEVGFGVSRGAGVDHVQAVNAGQSGEAGRRLSVEGNDDLRSLSGEDCGDVIDPSSEQVNNGVVAQPVQIFNSNSSVISFGGIESHDASQEGLLLSAFAVNGVPERAAMNVAPLRPVARRPGATNSQRTA